MNLEREFVAYGYMPTGDCKGESSIWCHYLYPSLPFQRTPPFVKGCCSKCLFMSWVLILFSFCLEPKPTCVHYSLSLSSEARPMRLWRGTNPRGWGHHQLVMPCRDWWHHLSIVHIPFFQVVLSATVGLVNGNSSFQLDSLGRDEDRCDMATGSSPFMRRTEEKEKGAATALPGQSRDRGIFLGFFQA